MILLLTGFFSRNYWPYKCIWLLVLFIASWKVPPENRDRILERFLQTHESPIPGVRIVGRWHRTDGTGGWMVVEAESMRPVTDFAHEWNDLLFGEIAPVVADEDLTYVLETLKNRKSRAASPQDNKGRHK